ncbi:MAG: hypothetical protein V1821_03385 [bacterium]
MLERLYFRVKLAWILADRTRLLALAVLMAIAGVGGFFMTRTPDGLPKKPVPVSVITSLYLFNSSRSKVDNPVVCPDDPYFNFCGQQNLDMTWCAPTEYNRVFCDEDPLQPSCDCDGDGIPRQYDADDCHCHNPGQ